MNLLKDDMRKIYSKYLFASLGSALAVSIYSFVDTIAVGQSEGPAGAAAMSVISPLYGLIVCTANLFGLGGAVLTANSRGEGMTHRANSYFTASCILVAAITMLIWPLMIIFHDGILKFFGASDEMLPKVMEYAGWIIYSAPLFIFPMFISSFIRNDNAPGLAMNAVIAGGLANVIGDYVFVFPMKMGMRGAALATVLGTLIQAVIMATHFMNKSCGLRLVKPERIFAGSIKVFTTGLSSGVLDFSMMIIVIITNNQIMRYGDMNTLAIYGCAALVVSLIQALYSGTGQALQPIASLNFGAGLHERVRKVFAMSIFTALTISILFACIFEFFPLSMIKIIMSATPEVISQAPYIVRIYGLVLIPMSLNITVIYYLQSVMKNKPAMTLSVLRSIALSGVLLFVLPLFFGLDGVLIAMPASEFVTLIIALRYIITSR